MNSEFNILHVFSHINHKKIQVLKIWIFLYTNLYMIVSLSNLSQVTHMKINNKPKIAMEGS